MSQIRKGAILSYITVAFNIISGFFFTPYLIGKVGKSMYGIYTLVITFLNYFLIDFGIGNSVAKYISEYRAEGESEKINKFVSVVFKIFAIIALIVGVILFFIYFFVDAFFSGLAPEEIIILKQMYIISGISSVLLFLFVPLDGILNAFECFSQQKISELLRKVFIIIFSVVALSRNNSVVWVSAVNALVGIAIVILKLIFVRKCTPVKPAWKSFDVKMVKAVAGISVWFALIMLEQRLIVPLAPTILGKFSNSEEISIMSIATTIEGYIYTIAACLNGLFLPKLTKLVYENKIKEVNRLFVLVGRIQIIIIGLIISVFVVFGKEFIDAWVGNGFEKAYYLILLIVSPAIVIYAQEIANSMLMIEHKKLKYKVICYGVGAVISIAGGCMLAPKYGALGTATGIALCMWISHVVIMNIIYSRLTCLDVRKFFADGYSRAIPIMIVLIALAMAMDKYLPRNGYVLLLVKMLLFSVFYLLAIWFFGVRKEEREMILKSLKGFKVGK